MAAYFTDSTGTTVEYTDDIPTEWNPELNDYLLEQE